ncbi:HIT family protein [Mycoplasmatota bacterium]|nr:HIT family protein [Mycoplasmatota bacterium]
MNNCLFCKIVNKEIPGVTIYEDEKIIAFLDISQITKGHTLIIPKKHYENVFEIDEETISHLYKQVPKIAKAIMNAFQAKGLNVVNNNGEAAGQTVFHYHVHLIPRYNDNDGFRAIYTCHMDKYSKEDLENIALRIQEQIE